MTPIETVREQWDALAKPPGSLGRLEGLVTQFASIHGTEEPQLENPTLLLFAGDHGVTEADVSSYSSKVTAELFQQIQQGNAAVNVLAEENNVTIDLRNVGLANPVPDSEEPVRPGTANAMNQPAMSSEDVQAARDRGKKACQQAVNHGATAVALGEIGIGNTTACAAVAAGLLEDNLDGLVGPGSGLDAEGRQRKRDVVRRIHALHSLSVRQPGEVLRRAGGLEIAALTGAVHEATQQSLPVVVDGYITAVAALVAVREDPSCVDVLLAGHRSTEPGHLAVLDELSLDPLLDLGLRLGEGTGAVLALGLLQQSLALFHNMAHMDELHD